MHLRISANGWHFWPTSKRTLTSKNKSVQLCTEIQSVLPSALWTIICWAIVQNYSCTEVKWNYKFNFHNTYKIKTVLNHAIQPTQGCNVLREGCNILFWTFNLIIFWWVQIEICRWAFLGFPPGSKKASATTFQWRTLPSSSLRLKPKKFLPRKSSINGISSILISSKFRLSWYVKKKHWQPSPNELRTTLYKLLIKFVYMKLVSCNHISSNICFLYNDHSLASIVLSIYNVFRDSFIFYP